MKPSPHTVQALRACAASSAIALFTPASHAQADEDLAKKLSNPVAALISVPLQLNYDHRIGPDGQGHRYTLNFQPVVPIQLNTQWNLISRTIVPVISQRGVVGDSSQTGLGDITQSFFFSPREPTAGGTIWGAGPVILLPSGSEPELSARKWGLGPTIVLLQQDSGWTYGALANHIWGFGGVSTRPGVSTTFLQPFVSYTTGTAWTYGINAESTYDWKRSQWSVPVNLTVSKLLRFGGQPLSIGAGLRYWAQSPEQGPDGWGGRLVVTWLFPQ